MLEFRVSQLSDKGKHRAQNEDAKFVGPNYFIIADGMGGRKAGKQASRFAVEAAKHKLDALALGLKKGLIQEEKIAAYLGNILKHTNEFVYLLSDLENVVDEDDHDKFKSVVGAFKGFATTMDISFIHDGKLYVAHAGDSRVYLHRNGILGQLTTDHLTEQGQDPLQKGKITQYIGRESITPELICVPLKAGDKVLMATDGLTDLAEDREISNAFKKEFPKIKYALRKLAYYPQSIASRCAAHYGASVKDAQKQIGGMDNITLILVEYTGGKENE